MIEIKRITIFKIISYFNAEKKICFLVKIQHVIYIYILNKKSISYKFKIYEMF